MRPMDISKFRKSITKNITGMSVGFHDPDTWISTGSYGLNFLLSGDFYKGIPLGKVTILAGESGAGKSFIASGNVVKNAQEMGIFVVLIDSENALDESWLKALGVDTSPEKLLKLNMAMIDDAAKVISEFVKEYKKDYDEVLIEDRPKILFVIDSLGMMLTATNVNQFEAGDMKGDMGSKPKQLKALITNCVNMFGQYNIGLVATQHTYQAQGMFEFDDIISGGGGQIFAASMVIAMKKLKLKEDENGVKVTEVLGIRSVCKVMKSRYSKPFESIKLNIPYDTGLDPISGLFDIFEKCGKFVKNGNRYRYITKDGVEMNYFSKEWHDFEKMKVVMDEFSQDDLVSITDVSTEYDKEEEVL